MSTTAAEGPPPNPVTGRPPVSTEEVVAELVDVSCQFHVRLPGRGRGVVQAVDQVNLSVLAGQTLGLVGESGSGKSTLARLMLCLIRPTAGRVLLGGDDITKAKGAQLRTLRRRMQLVFQDPYSSFDPLATIGSSIGEALSVHTDLGGAGRQDRTAELLEQVRLPSSFSRRRPRELSGGQLQRAAIARALATEPQLLALDEPLSSLDVATQVQMVELLGELQERLGIAYLFISHDLNLVRSLSHRVAVMYLGRIVEEGPVLDIYGSAQHPYTQALLSASPSMDPARRRQRIVLEGDIPSPMDPPSGCHFRTRCRHAMEVCAVEVPRPRVVGNLTVCCHLGDPDQGAPSSYVERPPGAPSPGAPEQEVN